MTTRLAVIAAILLSSTVTPSLKASGRDRSEPPRDGSSEAKAILVPVPSEKSHAWQIAYLKKHFPEHYSITGPLSNLNGEHAFIGHDEQRKWYDYYAFTINGKKKEVYFDVSKQTWESLKKSGLAK